MGQWNISIQGHGIHDNGRGDDADRMLGDFLADLKSKGHEIEAAHFTVGTSRTVNASISKTSEPADA